MSVSVIVCEKEEKYMAWKEGKARELEEEKLFGSDHPKFSVVYVSKNSALRLCVCVESVGAKSGKVTPDLELTAAYTMHM